MCDSKTLKCQTTIAPRISLHPDKAGRKLFSTQGTLNMPRRKSAANLSDGTMSAEDVDQLRIQHDFLVGIFKLVFAL